MSGLNIKLVIMDNHIKKYPRAVALLQAPSRKKTELLLSALERLMEQYNLTGSYADQEIKLLIGLAQYGQSPTVTPTPQKPVLTREKRRKTDRKTIQQEPSGSGEKLIEPPSSFGSEEKAEENPSITIETSNMPSGLLESMGIDIDNM